MERIVSQPRAHWRQLVESQGLYFHTEEGLCYWDESVYYAFSLVQIEELENATEALEKMCRETINYLIEHREQTFPRFGIPVAFWDYVCQSWEDERPTLYGRFDFSYDGQGPPKLLEYNADTPTSLLESAVIQWFWKQDLHPAADQYNLIHELLIEAYQDLQESEEISSEFYFASLPLELTVEDYMTTMYMQDVALQAGLKTRQISVEEITYHPGGDYFCDVNAPIEHIFKLYPWEWMVRDEFGPYLLTTITRWYEPPWKMLLSNKALLPYLWQLFPESEYVLKASFRREDFGDTFVRKPILSREGQDVLIVQAGQTLIDTKGSYADEPVLYQEFCPLAAFAGDYRPMLGSWVVRGEPCGLGIRETAGLVTNNTSRFVPHIIR